MANIDPHTLRAAQRGERRAQHQLYQTFATRVFGVCLRYGRNRQQAEDMAQEAWLRAFAKLGQFKHDGSFEGWLRRLTVNVCLRMLQRGGLKLEELPAVLPKGLHQSPDAVAALSAEELLNHVQTLPEGYRVVFNLCAIEGYSHAEVAEQLGITESTSRSQLTKARARLQSRLRNLIAL